MAYPKAFAALLFFELRLGHLPNHIAIQLRDQIVSMPLMCSGRHAGLCLKPPRNIVFIAGSVVDGQTSFRQFRAGRLKSFNIPPEVIGRVGIRQPKATRACLVFAGENVDVELLGIIADTAKSGRPPKLRTDF